MNKKLIDFAAIKFIDEAKLHPIHKGKNYGYEDAIYTNSRTKLKIWCPLHQKYFWITPNNHLRGRKD